MEKLPDSSTGNGFSPSRRLILSIGGTGLLGGILGYFGMRNTGPSRTSVKTSTVSSSGTPTVISHSDPTAGEIPQDFQSYLNTEFFITPLGFGEARCKLTEVTPKVRQDTFKGSFVSFSLLFKASSGFLPEGGICRVRHEHLQEMEIFLSPVGRADKEMMLEAVFSERV